MGKRSRSGAQVVRIGARPGSVPGQPPGARRVERPTRRWLRREVSLVAVAIAVIAIAAVIGLGIAAKARAEKQAHLLDAQHYTQRATQYTAPAPPKPGEKPRDQEYGD